MTMDSILASAVINASFPRNNYADDKKTWLERNGFYSRYSYPPEDFEYVRYFFKYNDPVLIKRIKPGKRHIHDPPVYSYSHFYRTPILARKNDTVTITINDKDKTMTGSEFMNMQYEQQWHVMFIVGGETRAIYNEKYKHEIVTDPKTIQEYEDRMKPKSVIFNRTGAKVIDIWSLENLERY